MIDEADVLNDLDQLRSRYDVLRRLGHDGACIVYGVRSPASGRHFAVKVMDNPGTSSARAGSLHVWQAHTMEKVDHPNILELHAVHHLQGGAVALAMERRRGRTLGERLDEAEPLSVAEVERILRDIAEGLRYLHGRGAVHRGVSPRSIFLEGDGAPARLGHFAIDGAGEDPTVTADPAALRRAFAFLAPEQIDGEAQIENRRLSDRSDLYSLGLVGFAMLTGEHPWEGASIKNLVERRKSEPLTPLATLRPDAPAYLHQAIEGCLDPNPRRRWKSVEEFLARLDPTSEITRAVPAIDWAGARARIESAMHSLSSVFRKQPRIAPHSRLALAVPGVLIGLVALSALADNDGPSASGSGERLAATTSDSEIVSEEFAGSSDATPAPAPATLPGIAARPPAAPASGSPGSDDTTSETVGETSPSASPRPSFSIPAATRRAPLLGDTVGSGGLVLLGDPVSR